MIAFSLNKSLHWRNDDSMRHDSSTVTHDILNYVVCHWVYEIVDLEKHVS